MTKKQKKEFFERLEGKEGCNFREVKGEPTWDCKGGMNKDLSIDILCNQMGLDTSEVVEFLIEVHNQGGHCDCEIIFNASEV